MTKEQKTIVIVDDRLWCSIARDSYTFGLLLAMTMIGHVIGLPALSWIGGFFWVVLVFTMAQRTFANNRMSVDQAKNYLEKLGERDGD